MIYCSDLVSGRLGDRLSLKGVVPLVAADPAVSAAVELAGNGASGELTLPPSATASAIAALSAGVDAAHGRPVLVVTATMREAEDLTEALRSLVDANTVADFPSWETLPHERLSPRADTVGRRLAVLRRLAKPDAADPGAGHLDVVVAPVRAVLQPFVVGLGRASSRFSCTSVMTSLSTRPFVSLQMPVTPGVTSLNARGEFAVRGGILDVFPALEEHPLRVELWGDTVEEIRYFKAADQRSLEAAEHGLWAPPVRELPLTEEVRERAREAQRTYPGLADVLSQLAEGIAVDGMESLSPLLTDAMELLVDVMPERTMVAVATRSG